MRDVMRSAMQAARNVRLNRAGGVKQFVTIRESGIERRPKPWNGKMALHRGGDQRGGAICLRSWAIFCCFLV